MNISVIGTGYVGLVVGACLAETGNTVCCADIDEKKIERLRKNDIPIYEPGLEPLVERNQKEQRLSFTTDLAEAIASADVVFIAVGKPLLLMDISSAEMTKYAANGMLATRISFMNEIANLCDKVGANVDFVRRGIGSDSRIGQSFLFPGPGYGGSCFPKDVKALVKMGAESGVQLDVLAAVESANDRQKTILLTKIKCALGDQLSGRRVAVWGLAFKAGTDDMREAPSLTLIEALLEEGVSICAHDPAALQHARSLLGNRIDYAETNYEALAGADALVVVTDWNEYRHPDFERVKRTLKQPVVVDGRNLYDVEKMRELGVRYHSIGRPSA